MSYYQWTTAEICLNNHEVYNTKEEIKEAIDENKQMIEDYKEELFGYMCCTPKDIVANEEDKGNVVDFLKRRFKEIFESELYGLEYLIAHNVNLQYMYDNFDKSEKG